MPFTIVGKPPAKGDRYNGDESYRPVSPHYFQVFHIAVRRGRSFGETDVPNSARVVIINEALARKYWPKENPLGKVIGIGTGWGPDGDDPPRQHALGRG